MQVIGGNKGNVDTLQLTLGSLDTHFKYSFQPFVPDHTDGMFNVSSDVIIRFNDSRELDMFIRMLQKFQSKNQRYIGDWEEV
jgi:hypothetical protein